LREASCIPSRVGTFRRGRYVVHPQGLTSCEKPFVVEFALVGEHVAVGVRSHGEVALADMLADPAD
jgi:hypothetical protein